MQDEIVYNMHMKSICVIVVTYRNPLKELERLKKSLLENGIKEEDIYFSDNTVENLGYSGGINRILKKVLKKYDYFFIVNPDVKVQKNCIKQLLETFEKDERIGIVGPKILGHEGKIWAVGGVVDNKRYSGGLGDFGKKDKEYSKNFFECDYIPGTAMLIKREVFEKVGFFPEKYFLYYEDDAFSLSAKNVGFHLVTNPHAVVTHYESTVTGKGSPLMQYYLARNHLLFIEQYAPLFVKIREFIRLPKTLQESNKYELLGIRDYFLRRFGKRDYWTH